MSKPTSAPTAEMPANTSSNKSTPMLTIAAPKNVTKWVLLIVVTFAVIVGIMLLVASVKRDRAKVAQAMPQYQQQTTTIPLASSPQSSWPKLVLAADGRSENIPIPPGMRIVMSGNGFVLHTMYTDGHECSFEESGVCPVGAYTGSYAKNKVSETNIVAYAFAPIE